MRPSRRRHYIIAARQRAQAEADPETEVITVEIDPEAFTYLERPPTDSTQSDDQ